MGKIWWKPIYQEKSCFGPKFIFAAEDSFYLLAGVHCSFACFWVFLVLIYVTYRKKEQIQYHNLPES